MSTISSWRSSSSVGNYIYQVVGQSSVISGTESQTGIVFRQGFVQPTLQQKKTLPIGVLQTAREEGSWSFQAYPNPFYQVLNIHFDQNMILPIRLVLYDIEANIIWEQSYLENQNEIKLDEFQGIKSGKYILKIEHKGISKTLNLIKEFQ
jgi:hypothetical protein